MPITRIHSFLILPAKGLAKEPRIGGVRLPLSGRVFDLLSALYNDAEADCDIEIVFRPTQDGAQNNERRDQLLRYASAPTVAHGRAIAQELQRVTTRRSGYGLFFLVAGSELRRRLMLARFPAHEGIVAEARAGDQLAVEFIERVFMKNTTTYKSVIYAGPLQVGAFWHGKAVDKQINGVKELSNYWIGDFLDSELLTTSAAGTKRLAEAFRRALKAAPNAELKSDLLAAVRLVRGHDGRVISPERLVSTLRLPDNAKELVRHELPRHEIFKDQFRFDRDEFDRNLMYKTVELDNGAILTAENARFDDIFSAEPVDIGRTDRTRFTTEGAIVDQRLRKTVR